MLHDLSKAACGQIECTCEEMLDGVDMEFLGESKEEACAVSCFLAPDVNVLL